SKVCSRLTAVIQLFDLLAPDRSLRAAGYWSAIWRRFTLSTRHRPRGDGQGQTSRRSKALSDAAELTVNVSQRADGCCLLPLSVGSVILCLCALSNAAADIDRAIAQPAEGEIV